MDRFMRKLKIVAGSLSQSYHLQIFESLNRDFQVDILAYASVFQGEHEALNFKLQLLENVPNMPGFMRDIGLYLQDADLVLVVDEWHLSSFQAVRFCKQNQIPCAVLSLDGTLEKFTSYLNIASIQKDCLENADLILTLSESHSFTVNRFLSEPKKINRVQIIPERSLFTPEKQSKFRSYFNLSPSTIIVTFDYSFFDESQTRILLSGVKSFLDSVVDESKKNIRFIFWGQGDGIQSAKYICSDLGLASQCFFLNQNAAPFWSDFISAADIWVSMPCYKEDIDGVHQSFNAFIAYASGCLTLASHESAEASQFKSQSHFFEVDFRQEKSLAFKLSQAYDLKKKVLRKDASSLHEVSEVNFTINDSLVELAKSSPEHSKTFAIQKKVLEELSEKLDRKDSEVDGSISKLEAFYMGPDQVNVLLKGQFSFLKGKSFYLAEEHELAVAALEKAIDFGFKDSEVYEILGFICLKNVSYAESQVFFRKALSSNHQNYHAYFGLGLIGFKLGQIDFAFRSIIFGFCDVTLQPKIKQLLLQYRKSTTHPLVAYDTLWQAVEILPGDLQLSQALAEVCAEHGLKVPDANSFKRQTAV